MCVRSANVHETNPCVAHVIPTISPFWTFWTDIIQNHLRVIELNSPYLFWNYALNARLPCLESSWQPEATKTYFESLHASSQKEACDGNVIEQEPLMALCLCRCSSEECSGDNNNENRGVHTTVVQCNGKSTLTFAFPPCGASTCFNTSY